jgi:hypothetical protein
MAKWLDKYEQGGLVLKKKTKDNYGKKPNVNDVKVSAGPGFEGDGYTAQNWKSPAWGGQFAMGGSLPGTVGFMYARTQNPAPANGKYTKKTLASAQDGRVLSPDADDRSLLGFDTSDPAFQNVKANAFVPFDRKDFEGIRQNMAGYMNSPLYMERLSKSIPDAENAKDVQQRRLNNLLGIKLNPDYVDYGTHYNANQNRINIGARDFVDNSIIGHELAHGVVPNITNSYGKQNIFAKVANVVGDIFQPYEQFSNSELEKINIPLSGKITTPNFDYRMARKEEHYKPQGSKASAKTAANETYGDLTGMRQLLLDNGITTEFGQELTPEIFKKAKSNKRVINSPTFKRMRLKFKDEDIIKMNNEVAYNDDNAPFDQAQNGKEMSFYQNGLDFKPKSISKKGKKIIKDDMGQWAHPGEVTEIGSPDITMQGVDYPVLGISDTGDTQMMYPDQDYKFDGDKVTEFPMMEKGGWLDKYKAQSGRTAAPYGSLQGDLPEVTVTSTKPSKWGKFKFAPYDPSKNPESISQWNPKPGEREAMAAAEQARRDEENSWYNNKHIKSFRNSAFMDPKALAIGTAAALIGPEVIPYVGAALETPIVAGLTANHLLGAAAVTHGINQLPETAQSVRTAYNNPNYENVVNAINDVGWNALDIAPVAPVAKTASQEVKAAINASKESGLLSNTYKVNPFAFKPKSDAYYRMVGEGGYADALESGVVRPPVGSGHTEAYYNKGYPLDTRLRDATGRAGYGGPYMAEVKGDPELFVNENVANYTGPMFDDPVVYSKQNIPINNPNLKFYKEDWLRGYKEVPKPTGSEATQNIFIPKPIDDIFKSVGSYYQEKLGETFAGAKNRAAIKEGNEWFQNWIDDPLTKNKIKNQIIDQQLLGKRAPLVSDRINDPNTMQDWGYLTSYRAGAKEYPLVYQKNDLIDFLKGHKRYNTPMIHADNWGVSYRHGQPYSWDTQQIYGGDRTSGGGTWVSRSLDIPQVARTSTTVHENTHDWLRDQAMERLGYKDLILKNMKQDAATNWADFSIHRDVGKNPIGYLADPTEVHARIMEARKHFGLTPGEYVTEERAKDIIERIGKGRSPISRRFPEIFDNPKQTAYLFNRLPAVAPVAVGVGAGALATQAGSDKQKNGGWLNKYK